MALKVTLSEPAVAQKQKLLSGPGFQSEVKIVLRDRTQLIMKSIMVGT